MIFNKFNVNIKPFIQDINKATTAIQRYNNMSNKSVSFQNKYNGALVKSNTSLSKYLKSLNGSKATMGGYIKSLIGAKAASIGLQVATAALEMTITMGLSFAITGLISLIQKWASAQEEARQKSVELTNSYKEQQSSLDSQIEKYKELKKHLDSENISTNEVRSIKEQLLEVQQSLIETYGDEASNIDLVNGKYREQLELLGALSKEKAIEYVTENRDVFKDAKKALEKERTYNLGSVTSWNTYSPKTEEQQALLDYIESYSDLLDLTDSNNSSRGVTSTTMNLSVKADVENADELMHQFAKDLEKYGKDNNIDVSGILEGISEQLKKTWTDELTEYKTVYDEFMKAEIVRNDTLRPLYEESIQAVEDYNNALSSGEGIDEAKANLDSVKKSVQNITGELEGSQDVFDDIYDNINKDAEASYNLSQAFQNNKTVQNYAEQLRGLTDIDLNAINFDNDNTEKGEEAFKSLVETLGLNEDQIQNLINKLIELGYVYGETKKEILEDEIDIPLTITDSIEQLNTKLKPAMDSIESAWQNIFTEDGFNLDEIDLLSIGDSIQSKLDGLSELGLDVDYTAYEDFIRVLENTESTEDDVRNAFDNLAQSIINAGVSGTEDFETLKDSLEDLGVINNDIIAFQSLVQNVDALTASGLDLADATYEDIEAFANECVEAENVMQAIEMLTYQKILNGLADMDTSSEIANMIALAEKAGVTADVINYLTELEKIYQEVASGTLDADSLNGKLARAEELKSLIEGEVSNVNYEPEVIFKPKIKTGSGSGGGSGSEYDWKNLLDKEIAVLEKQLDAGLIDFDTYLGKRLDLIEKYYQEGKIKAEDYYEYLEKTYENQLSIYDRVISAVTNKLEKQIEQLEKQKEAIEEGYQLQIDKLNEEIELLEKEYQKKKDLEELEQARYNAEKARNQRTKRLYTGDNFTYVADDEAVRDAEEDLADKELQMNISRLEEQIESLEKEMEEATKLIDEQIEKLQEYIEQWNDVADTYEEAQNEMLASQVLGAQWEAEILALRQDVLEQFKNEYVRIQEEMANAALKAAEAQLEAEKLLAKGGGSGSGSGGAGGNNPDNSSEKHEYNGTVYNSKQEAEDAKDREIKELEKKLKSVDSGNTSADEAQKAAIKEQIRQVKERKITKCAKGGVIKKSDNIFSPIAESIGEDTMIAVRDGERVLTPIQNKHFEKLISISDKLVPALLKGNLLNNNLFGNLQNNNMSYVPATANSINISIGDINLHEVNDVNTLSQAIISQLPNKISQAINRR